MARRYKPPVVAVEDERSRVRTARIAVVEHTARHMVAGDVRMAERLLLLTGERCRTAHHHVGLVDARHLLAHQVHARELWIVDRELTRGVDDDIRVGGCGLGHNRLTFLLAAHDGRQDENRYNPRAVPHSLAKVRISERNAKEIAKFFLHGRTRTPTRRGRPPCLPEQ